MIRDTFAEIAVTLPGTLGLYRENGWLALVRVETVSFDENGASLGVQPIPTHGLRSDHDRGWSISSIWAYLEVTPECWGQPYPSVSIHFAPELVSATVEFASTLPPGFTPEHYRLLWKFMAKFRPRRPAIPSSDTIAGDSGL